MDAIAIASLKKASIPTVFSFYIIRFYKMYSVNVLRCNKRLHDYQEACCLKTESPEACRHRRRAQLECAIQYDGDGIAIASLRKTSPSTILGWFVLWQGEKTAVIKLIQYLLYIPQVPGEKFTILTLHCTAPETSFSAPLRKHQGCSKDCAA